MVKKLISGILNKSGKEEQVPDELPPIKGDEAEAATPESAQAAVPPQAPVQTQTEEAPLELPAIEETAAPQAAPIPEPLPPAASNVPPDLNAEQNVQNKSVPAKNTSLEEERPSTFVPEHEGFFSRLTHLVKSQKDHEKLLNQNLVSTMKETYTIKKESTKTGLNQTEDKRIKHSIDEVIEKMKLLETKWRSQKIVLEEDERALKEYEQHLVESEKELKKLLRQYKIYEVPEKPLPIKNYLDVKNISELYNALRTIDDKTFFSHITNGKNDFSDFVVHVDKSLAEKVAGAKSKSAMIRVLEIFIAKYKT